MVSDGVIGVLTGPWLIAKWAGIAILSAYLVLLIFAIARFRGKLSQLRFALVVPLVLGNFVGLSLPWLFMNAAFTRICFVLAHASYIYGIAVLVKNFSGKHEARFLRADS